MGRKRKPFIDKKHAQRFSLVHRSQRDPLINADGAGERVLLPVEASGDRRAELEKYGVYFDDNYDYLQHLRDVDEVQTTAVHEERFRLVADGRCVESADAPDRWNAAKATSAALQLPSTVFETVGIELETGLLNQAAPRPGPQPQLEPDIVAALDGAFDFESADDELEDDFVALAQGETTAAGLAAFRESAAASTSADGDSDSDDAAWQTDSDESDDARFVEEETRSRFTEYSLTSSVMRRSDGLQTLDRRFEKIYEQYDEDEPADLALEDEAAMGGHIEPDSQRMLDLIREHEEGRRAAKVPPSALFEEREEGAVRLPADDDDEEATVVLETNEAPKERWDCASIISTYSNIYNRPKLIAVPASKRSPRIRLDARGLPQTERAAVNAGLTRKRLRQLDAADSMEVDEERGSVRSRVSTVRSTLETPEERRQRKRLVRLERKERRVEKKANKEVFKDEKKRLSRQNAAAQQPALLLN